MKKVFKLFIIFFIFIFLIVIYFLLINSIADYNREMFVVEQEYENYMTGASMANIGIGGTVTSSVKRDRWYGVISGSGGNEDLYILGESFKLLPMVVNEKDYSFYHLGFLSFLFFFLFFSIVGVFIKSEKKEIIKKENTALHEDVEKTNEESFYFSPPTLSMIDNTFSDNIIERRYDNFLSNDKMGDNKNNRKDSLKKWGKFALFIILGLLIMYLEDSLILGAFVSFYFIDRSIFRRRFN